MCNKTIFYNSPIPGNFENFVYLCHSQERPSKHWLPKSMEEIMCVIRNLPEGFYKHALWVIAQKNYCQSTFSFCSMPHDDNYVKFNSSLLPWAPKAFNSTREKSFACLSITYKIVNKTDFLSLEFQEKNCSSTALGICEVI
ncbi:uncharacterized protein LOC135940174 [Cloeon dipterum]|uniref:uncharacterized protein LOC135940174 n=1 Tax=Cloeon dipterum TaxID=197152 RepID=UPI0032206C75